MKFLLLAKITGPRAPLPDLRWRPFDDPLKPPNKPFSALLLYVFLLLPLILPEVKDFFISTFIRRLQKKNKEAYFLVPSP